MALSIHLKHPFTMMISGPSGSGKTYFVRDMINAATKICDPPPSKITYFYGEYQNIFNSMPNVTFIEGLQQEEIAKAGGNSPEWVVIDDLMREASNSTFVSDLFTKGSHHRNISVIYIAQNFFTRGKENRTISINCHYLVIFKNPRDVSIVTNLGRQMWPHRTKVFQAIYEEATMHPFSYLFIDLKPDTPNNLRLLTNILNEHDRPMIAYSM